MALQSDHEFAPTEIARAVFPTAFRGYDQDAVRRYLSRLAAALEHQQTFESLGAVELSPAPADERVDELEAEIVALQEEIRELETELVQRSVDEAEHDTRRSVEAQEFDEHRAIELLGQETARVLESARSAAADILKRAENQAATLKAEAKKELSDARRQAKQLVADKQAEADEAIDQLTAEAEAEARAITDEADQHRITVVEESSRILADAEAQAEVTDADAQARARQVVADAEALRQQVIAELVSERRMAQTDLDRLSEARDRLALSLAVARSELDDLADALADASTSSTRVGDGVSVEVDGDEVARLIDHLDARSAPDAVDPAPDPDQPSTGEPEGGGSIRDDHDEDLAGDLENDTERRAALIDEPTQEMPAVGSADASKVTDEDHPAAIAALDDDHDPGPPAGGVDDVASSSRAGDRDEQDHEPLPVIAVDEDDGQGEGERSVGVFDDEADEIDLRELELDPALVSDDLLNPRPSDGGPVPLVEGFNTIVLGDDDLAGRRPDDQPQRGGTESEMAEGAPVVALVEPDADPELVITTVAARTGARALDRTQGDLLSDEPLSRRLPALFKARDVAITRSGANLRRQLRRALNDDQSEVLDRLRSGRGKIGVEELMTEREQIEHYQLPLRRGLAEIVRAGARAGGLDAVVEVGLDNLVDQLALHLVERVRVPTEAAIAEADHNDRERILEPIRALYRDFRNVALPDLLDDALHEAFAIGLYDSIEDGQPVRWEVDPRTDPDPVCDINRDRDEQFKAVPFPSGHVRPLAVPGCRCLVVPVP